VKIKKEQLVKIIKEEIEHAAGEIQELNGAVDEDAADELYLFITSTEELYERQYLPIIKNLNTKRVRGVYVPDLAVKLFMYLVDSGAKLYAKYHGGGGHVGPSVGGFNKPTRLEVAKRLTSDFEVEAELGNFDYLLPKKYQK